MKKKILGLLVLLSAAVSGAWADNFDYEFTAAQSEQGSGTVAFYINSNEVQGAMQADEGKEVTVTITPDAGWVVDVQNVTATPNNPWESAGARRNAPGDIGMENSVALTYVSTDETTGTATFTFLLPAAGVRITPAYTPIAAFAEENQLPLVPTAIEGVVAGEQKDIVAAGTVAKITGTNNPQGTVKYFATLDPSLTAAQALQANGWTDALPTAAVYTSSYAEDFKVYVWYYIQAATGYADSKPQCIEVTVGHNLFTLNLVPTRRDNITVEVNNAAQTVTDGKVTPVKMGSTVKLKADTGYKFRKVEVKKGEAVTTNAAEEGATFTEATFTMPASDATVEYELVRDMSVQMTVQVGDGTEEQPRYRLKKQNDVYVPADMNVQQLMALVKIHDAIENKDLAFYVDCTICIFAVDDNDQPTGDAVAFTALTPGRYVAQATAAQGSDYDGQTGYSNIFILYEKEITKHPVAIEGLIYSAEPQVLITPAECIGGEMRYSLDGENWSADLPAGVDEGTYTIYYKVIADENDNDPFYQTVEGIIISEMPFDDALEDLDAAIKHAIGVLALVGKDMGNVEIPLVRTIYDADDLYKLAIDPLTAGDVTSKQIVDMIKRLRDEEKAFLADSEVEEEISTGISTVGTDTGSDAWFDLNGRRLQQKPAKPGVYVKNGLKVVVK